MKTENQLELPSAPKLSFDISKELGKPYSLNKIAEALWQYVGILSILKKIHEENILASLNNAQPLFKMKKVAKTVSHAITDLHNDSSTTLKKKEKLSETEFQEQVKTIKVAIEQIKKKEIPSILKKIQALIEEAVSLRAAIKEYETYEATLKGKKVPFSRDDVLAQIRMMGGLHKNKVSEGVDAPDIIGTIAQVKSWTPAMADAKKDAIEDGKKSIANNDLQLKAQLTNIFNDIEKLSLHLKNLQKSATPEQQETLNKIQLLLEDVKQGMVNTSRVNPDAAKKLFKWIEKYMLSKPQSVETTSEENSRNIIKQNFKPNKNPIEDSSHSYKP